MEVSNYLGFRSFHRKGVDGGPCVPCRNLGKEQRIQDQKSNRRRQKTQQPVCNVKQAETLNFIVGDPNDFEGLAFHGIKNGKV